jgi:hypothetical protein
MSLEKRLVTRAANALLRDVKTNFWANALGQFEADRAQDVFGGMWVGGRATLTTSFLVFRANRLNRAMQTGGLDVIVPLASVQGVTFERSIVTNIVEVRAEAVTLRLRCYKAKAFADAVVEATATARTAAGLEPGQSFAASIRGAQHELDLRYVLEGVLDRLVG